MKQLDIEGDNPLVHTKKTPIEAMGAAGQPHLPCYANKYCFQCKHWGDGKPDMGWLDENGDYVYSPQPCLIYREKFLADRHATALTKQPRTPPKSYACKHFEEGDESGDCPKVTKEDVANLRERALDFIKNTELKRSYFSLYLHVCYSTFKRFAEGKSQPRYETIEAVEDFLERMGDVS